MNIDWNQTLEDLPDDLNFEDLPPLAKDLVRRNANLRESAQLLETQLRYVNSRNGQTQSSSVSQKIGVIIEENEILKKTNEQLKSKIENFRGMIARRDGKIEKLENKRRQ